MKWTRIIITPNSSVHTRLRGGPGVTFPGFGILARVEEYEVEASALSVYDGVSYWLHVRGLRMLGEDNAAWINCAELASVRHGNTTIRSFNKINQRYLDKALGAEETTQAAD